MNADTRAAELSSVDGFQQEEPVGGESKNKLETNPYGLSNQTSLPILLAQMEHLSAAKKLADKHKRELGFINQAILRKAIASQSLLVALGSPVDSSTGTEFELAGMVQYYVRRDNTVTLCNIVVAQAYQRTGLGHRLFEELVRLTCLLGKTQIRLKCPAELPANHFYERLGLKVIAVEPGKHRPLNVWVYTIDDQL